MVGDALWQVLTELEKFDPENRNPENFKNPKIQKVVAKNKPTTRLGAD